MFVMFSNQLFSECGDCYGAESVDFPCCDTCEDVITAYEANYWGSQLPEIPDLEQCRGNAT